MKIYRIIKEEAQKAYPNECWGYIYPEGKILKTFPCENLAKDKLNCVITDPRHYIKACDLGAVSFYHSHPTPPSEIHKFEQQICNELMMSSIIYTNYLDKFDVLDPDGKIFPLEDRPFLYGVFDCWTLVRDKILLTDKRKLTNYKEPWGWWTTGGSAFLENIEKEGYRETNELKDGNVILMNWKCDIPNHIGYYEGGRVLHHYLGGTSRWDDLGAIQKYFYKMYSFS